MKLFLSLTHPQHSSDSQYFLASLYCQKCYAGQLIPVLDPKSQLTYEEYILPNCLALLNQNFPLLSPAYYQLKKKKSL